MSTEYTQPVRAPASGGETISPMEDRDLERRIGEAADTYQHAAEAKESASKALADLMRQAYAQREQQTAILRAAKHVWSREYLRIVLGLNKRRPGDGKGVPRAEP